MTSLAGQEVWVTCCARLDRLDPNVRPKWGRMTAHQMICHLSDSFQVGLGERQASPAPVPIPRGVYKWIALRTPFRWPRGVPTRPEVEQGVGGTPPGEWGQDLARLRETVLTFASRCRAGEHPIFGRMTVEDWQIWGYRHLDHHLRQFGV